MVIQLVCPGVEPLSETRDLAVVGLNINSVSRHVVFSDEREGVCLSCVLVLSSPYIFTYYNVQLIQVSIYN
jgi:hypothetical protein